MKIVVLGMGSMGVPLARLAESAGHEVRTFSSRGNPIEALKSADLVFLAIKYEQVLDLAKRPGVVEGIAGKIVVDITNPLTPDFMNLTIGHNTSAAEEIVRCFSSARVVKAFNTVFAALLAMRANGEFVAVPVFVVGDDDEAVKTVANLSQAFGFQTIIGGALSNARYLEPMAEFMIRLGYGLGYGDKIGFGLLGVKT